MSNLKNTRVEPETGRIVYVDDSKSAVIIDGSFDIPKITKKEEEPDECVVYGVPGKDGRDVYQVWLDNGYVGSEKEFLDWCRFDSQLAITKTMMGIPDGVATLDKDGSIPVEQLPPVFVSLDENGLIHPEQLPPIFVSLDGSGLIPEELIPPVFVSLDENGLIHPEQIPPSVVSLDENGLIHPEQIPPSVVSLDENGLISPEQIPPSVVSLDENGLISPEQIPSVFVSLDESGLIPEELIPSKIMGLRYMGYWDSKDNLPNLSDPATFDNQFYIAANDGDSVVGELGDWRKGDWILSLGGKITKFSSGTRISVNGIKPDEDGDIKIPMGSTEQAGLLSVAESSLLKVNDGELTLNISYTDKGEWNAATNTPLLEDPPPPNSFGDYYIVSEEGGSNLSGINVWQEGDVIVSVGSRWLKYSYQESVTVEKFTFGFLEEPKPNSRVGYLVSTSNLNFKELQVKTEFFPENDVTISIDINGNTVGGITFKPDSVVVNTIMDEIDEGDVIELVTGDLTTGLGATSIVFTNTLRFD